MLAAVGPMSPGLTSHLASILTPAYYPKKTEILRYGQVCRNIFFIGQGMVVGRQFQKNQEITPWIMREGNIATSPESFFKQTPAQVRMITVEPCHVAGITFQQLEDTYLRYPEFHLQGHLLTQQYYLMSLERGEDKKRFTAKEKYLMLLEKDPEIAIRCPNKYLAGYLDVNESTLSTVRGSLRKRK